MIRTVRWLAVFATLSLGAVALSACSGGGNNNVLKTPAATQSSTNGNGELAGVATKYASSTFQATYKVSGSGSDTLSGGQFVMYKDGQKRLRFDASVTQDAQSTDVIFISTDTVSAFCFKDVGDLAGLLGVTPGTGVCFKSNPDDPNNPVASISSLFQDLETTNVTLLDKSSRIVAGKDTTCYRTKDNSTAEISTACFTSDGVLMYTNTEGTDAFEMEATSVTGSLKDSDFDVPYELRDFPSIGG